MMNYLVNVQYHMKRYTEMVINLMKKEKLFAEQGGPIIMAQVGTYIFVINTNV